MSFVLAGLMVTRLKAGAPKTITAPTEKRISGLHAAFEPGMPGMILTTSVLGLHSSLLAVGVQLWISATGVVPS